MKSNTPCFQTTRRIAAWISACVLVVTLAGCEKPGAVTAQSKGAVEASAVSRGKAYTTNSQDTATRKQNAQNPEKDAENEAIDFHNYLYGFLAAANKPLDKISSEMKEAVDDAHRDHDSDRTRWRSLQSFGLGDNFAKIPTARLEPPDAFGSEDKKYINDGVQTVRDSVSEILSILNDLEKYYAAEDYKDDWFKKLYMAAPRMEVLIRTIRENSAPLRERVDDITEAIDAQNVSQIPVGQWVLNMRSFSKKYRAMTACLLRDEITEPVYGARDSKEREAARAIIAREAADKVESLCAELDTMADAQKDLQIEGYENSSYEKIYREFYKKYEDSKVTTRRVLRDLRDKNWTSDKNNIKGDQHDMAYRMSEFTKLWNEKGRRGK